MGQGRRKGTPRWQKAAALLPLVALSGAWSANASSDSADPDPEPAAQTAPVATPEVPDEIFSQPASVKLPASFDAPAELTPVGDAAALGSGAAPSYATAVNGIPTSALYAYRRAARILNAADSSCNIDWTLIAAIGRVESDHGRFGGSALDSNGKAQPGIFGLPLDGSGGSARILDSDDGAQDGDPVYDRAVGPMQFIPGTWEIAGVDADQDGVKDPQDIDDAATATGVYLCAGETDLSTDSGLREAVYRYNHSDEYVDLVLSIMAAYAGGNYAPVPNDTASAAVLTPRSPERQAGKAEAHQQTQHRAEQRQAPPDESSSEPRRESSGTQDGTQSPSGGGGSGGDSDGDSDGDKRQRNDDGRDGNGPLPSPTPTETSVPEPEEVVQTAEEETKKVVQKLDTVSEATEFCRSRLVSKGATGQMISACGEELVGKTIAEADRLLSGSLVEILGRLNLRGLLPEDCLPLVGC